LYVLAAFASSTIALAAGSALDPVCEPGLVLAGVVCVGAVCAGVGATAGVVGAAMAVFLATTMPEAAVAEVRLMLSRARCVFRVGKAGIRQRQTASSSSVGE